MTKRSIFLIGWLMLVALTVLPAQPLLRGLVYDQLNQRPLAQARVSLLGTSLEGVSNPKGFFQIESVPPGAYKVRFSHPGYRDEVKLIQVKGERVYSTGASLMPLKLDTRRERLTAPHGYRRDPFYSPYAQTLVHLSPWTQRQYLTLGEGLPQTAPLTALAPHYATPTVQLRGLGPQRLNWNMDGIPLSPSAQRHDRWLLGALLSPLDLARIEVQRGTGGLLYGQAGSAGTVHLHQQTPAFSGKGTQAHGRLLSFGQFGSSRYGAHGQVSVHQPRWAVQGSGSLQRWEALHPGGPTTDLLGSGFDFRSGQLTGSARLTARDRLTVGYRYAAQTGSLLAQPPLTTRPTVWPTQRDQASHQLAYLRHRHYFGQGWWHELRSVVAYQRLDEQRSASADQTEGLAETQQQVDTWSGRVELLSIPYPFWHMVSGVSATHDRSGGFRRVAPGGEPLPGELPAGGQATQLSAFNLHTIDLLKLHLAVGARAQVDLRRNLGPLAARDRWQHLHLSWNLSGMYPLSQQYQMVANLQSGYRSPSLFELGGLGPYALGVAAPAGSDLLGERSFTSEIGLKANTKPFSGSVMVYRTFLRNRIGYARGDFDGDDTYLGLPVYQARNLGQGYVTGVEAAVEVPIARRLSVYGQLTYAYGEDVARAAPLPGIPPLHTQLGLYARHRSGWWARAEWRYATRQARLAALDRQDPVIGATGLDAYHLVDVQVGYQFARGGVSLGMYNVLNDYAVSWGAGVPQPGHRLLLSAWARF